MLHIPIPPSAIFVGRKTLLISCVAFSISAVIISGCDKKTEPANAKAHDEQPGHSHDDGHEHEHEHDAKPGHSHDDGHEHAHGEESPTAGIPIPANVRRNLGITFANVEMRRVASTLRVPGRFETIPSAIREYHAPLAGRVELLVGQYDHVTTGTPLYRLDSTEWRGMQQELLSLEAEVAASSATLMAAQVAHEGGEAAEDVTRQRIAAAQAHINSVEASIKVAEERVRQVLRLQEIAGGQMSDINEARGRVASLRNELTQAREDQGELKQQRLQLSTEGTGGAFGTTETLKASLLARQAEYEATKARRDLLHASLLSIGGMNRGKANAPSIDSWQVHPEITIRAVAEGVVSSVGATSGGYVDKAAPILSTIDTSALRFRAVALQSDILRLDQEMAGRILRPGNATASRPGEEYIPVIVKPSLEADPEKRTLDLIAKVPAEYPWARAGVSTELELILDDTEDPEPAIPMAAVIQDGLEKVFFRRDPENPDNAIRVEADLGIDDGKWVAVMSGVKAGDQVVVEGVYELKLATAAAPAKAGHFHADGTFHEGED